ncbi:hypothetical protein PR003_g10829 [Phytophthora rubi]|uniref:Uncharacterized protein n=1 Tax=Phytophthora rubi TaxID=129364 RepID=A0A6A4FD82_9STRA|nr:hypothetical protein PR002_g10614 [Phytophthora rubi]KAE9033077.1 hypothetical protein PR001_g10323 [Phytophthora rubi]KAE9339804.1 hypothetical protein PR003_g10829 [Phytophthora rubi]
MCHAALLYVVAVLLHRYHPFLLCYSASSSAVAPMGPFLVNHAALLVAVLLMLPAPITRLHEC